jgi:TolB protein
VHYRPIQPRTEFDVTNAAAKAHGAIITGLSSTDNSNFNPVFSRPTVDNGAHEPEPDFGDVIFPTTFQSVNTFNGPNGEEQRLVLTPGQFQATGVAGGEVVGNQALFNSMDVRVLYSNSSDYIAPIISRLDAEIVGSTVSFTAEATDDSPATITDFLVVFRDATGLWRSVELVQTPNTNRWTGGASVTGTQVQVIGQAIDHAGNVGLWANKGLPLIVTPPEPPPSGVTVDVDGPPGLGGWFVGDATVTITGPEGLRYDVSVNGSEPFQYSAPFAVNNEGANTIAFTTSGGDSGSVTVPIDKSGPEITISVPPDGASYALGQSVNAAYSCADSGSGAASCNGTVPNGSPIATSSIGAKAFTVNATDAAGNSSSLTHRYNVQFPMVFASTRDGNFEIYGVNANGTGLARLTDHPASDITPVLSPDRTRIAFSSNRGGNWDLYVMNVDGTGVTRLTNHAKVDSTPAWSPDSQKLAFSSDRSGNFEIYRLNADALESGVTKLTKHSKVDGTPAWASTPSGEKIAFSSNRSGNFEIYTMNANDGSGVTKVTNHSKTDTTPSWSHDGTKIAFSSDRSGNFEIYTMNANGTGVVKRTTHSGVDATPSWSPDSANIAFTRTVGFNSEVYIMNADGTGAVALASHPAVDLTPDW